MQTGTYNFSPAELAQVDTALGNINPELPILFTNDGIITDPAYEAYTGTGALTPEFGGYDPNLLGTDLVTLFQDSLSSPTDPTLSADLTTLASDFSFPGNAANLAAILAGDPAAAAAGATDPTGLSADFSSLLASLGATAGSDALSQSLSELGTQFAAEFASLIPSMF